MKPEITTVVLNGELAIVGMSGEPFCQHAVRLRQRRVSAVRTGLWLLQRPSALLSHDRGRLGGGLRRDPRVSPIALGAGEAMIDRALINIYRLLGKFPQEPAAGE